MRRNQITITLIAKETVDEELLKGELTEDMALEMQAKGVETMLDDYLVFDEFYVTIVNKNEEEF